MGTDCAPFLANLYLFALEHQWVAKMQATGQIERARRCKAVYRFIDDLLAVDDEGEADGRGERAGQRERH